MAKKIKKTARKPALGKTAQKLAGKKITKKSLPRATRSRATAGTLGCCTITFGTNINRTPNVTQRSCRQTAEQIAGAVWSWTEGDCPSL